MEYLPIQDLFYLILRLDAPTGYSMTTMTSTPMIFLWNGTNLRMEEYTDHLSELAKAAATYKTHALPTGKFDLTEQLNSDQHLEIY